MSIALMTMARKTALPTNEKFVLMALADWADDNGTNCWPSVYELSEYLTCSERTVQRLLRDLEQGGWIAVVGNHNGGGTSRSYALNVPKMDESAKVEHARREEEKERRRSERKKAAANPFFNGCQSVTPDKLTPVTTTTQGVTTTTQGVTTTTLRGDTAVTPSTIDPPYIHHGTIIVGADAPKAKPASRATTLPADFRPDGTAEQIARDFGLDIHAEETAFSDFHSAKGTTFKDWQAGFRTWLRNANKFGQRATAARAAPVNKQEALEARNRAVGDAWVAKMLAQQGGPNAQQ